MSLKRADGPSVRDWALFAGSTIFVLIGFLILPSDRDGALVGIAFFGLCAAIGFATIRRKYRYRRLADALDVRVVGGTPIRESRFRIAIASGALAIVGIVIVAFGAKMGWVMQAVGGAMGLFGAAIVIGVMAGWLAAGSLTFEPRGLTVKARKWSYRVAWDNIAGISGGEFNGNATLIVRLHDRDAVAVEPPGAVSDVQRHFALNERWFSAQIAMLPSRYAVDLPIIARAIARYAFEPVARSELQQQRLR